MSRIHPLTESSLMSDLTVVHMKLDASEQARLSQLGLHRGGTVRVLQRAVKDPLHIAVGDARIGVKNQTDQKIFVL